VSAIVTATKVIPKKLDDLASDLAVNARTLKLTVSCPGECTLLQPVKLFIWFLEKDDGHDGSGMWDGDDLEVRKRKYYDENDTNRRLLRMKVGVGSEAVKELVSAFPRLSSSVSISSSLSPLILYYFICFHFLFFCICASVYQLYIYLFMLYVFSLSFVVFSTTQTGLVLALSNGHWMHVINDQWREECRDFNLRLETLA
jgi:hypothetical protein